MSDHAPQPARLQTVTTTTDTPQPANPGYTSFCTTDYDCPCQDCALETQRRVQRGIRPRQPIPTRRAA